MTVLDEVPNPVEEVTPDPEEAVTPDPPADPAPAEEPASNLEAIVMELKDKVDRLIADASASVPSPGEEGENLGEPADLNPVRKPWTHRGFFN